MMGATVAVGLAGNATFHSTAVAGKGQMQQAEDQQQQAAEA